MHNLGLYDVFITTTGIVWIVGDVGTIRTCGNTTGLNNVTQNDFYFEFYPNPSIDRIDLKINQKVASVEIYDINGKLVLETSESNSINLNQLNSGIYFLKVYCENMQVISKKNSKTVIQTY